MTAPTLRHCESCDELRPSSDLLEIVEVRTGWTFYTCRPGIGNGMCFARKVGPASVHRIRQAQPPERAA